MYRINILGEVANPGFYYVTDSEKFTAILAYRWWNNRDVADLGNIKLFRDFKEIEIDLEDFLKKGSTTTDFGLRSGDQIFVPRSWWADNSGWVTLILSVTALASNYLCNLL